MIKSYHQQVWPEVLSSIQESGILPMQICHMETSDTFTFDGRAKLDQNNATVQKWERLMDEKQRLPFARPGEKWVLMSKIFEL